MRAAHIFYHVSKLLNFLVTTLPRSMPRRSTMRCARSGCDEPLKTLMFGILLWRIKFLGPELLVESVGTQRSRIVSQPYHRHNTRNISETLIAKDERERWGLSGSGRECAGAH